MAPQKRCPRVSQGESQHSFFRSHILKVTKDWQVSKQKRPLQLCRGPKEQKSVPTGFIPIHTHHKHIERVQGGQELFITISEKAGAMAKSGLAGGGVLEKKSTENANNSPYTALSASVSSGDSKRWQSLRSVIGSRKRHWGLVLPRIPQHQTQST